MTNAVPLTWVLLLAAALFCVGLFGAVARRSAIGILFGVELMLNAVTINLVAFWRYLSPAYPAGPVFALFVITVAAAEAAVGLALVLAVYRARRTSNVDQVTELRQ